MRDPNLEQLIATADVLRPLLPELVFAGGCVTGLLITGLNSSDPYAWVDIERIGTPYVPQGVAVPIAAVAPGFFSAPYMAGAGAQPVYCVFQTAQNVYGVTNTIKVVIR